MARGLGVFFAASLAAIGAQALQGVDDPGGRALAARAEIMRLRARPAAFPTAEERDAILELLEDPDPGVQRAALRTLRRFVAVDAPARFRILAVFRDRSQTAAIRREAAKTLSYASADKSVRAALQEAVKAEPKVDLRAIAAKALFWQAAERDEVRRFLLDTARVAREPELKRAAVWALFLAAQHADVRDFLVELSRSDRDPLLRFEAQRSLVLKQLRRSGPGETVDPLEEE
ncbi:MAG: hypothetical protein HY078_04880 [Elusimicrobia bacterium]|nr:hypothetical protein [Elusimicrobiota bacterium]